MSDSLRTTPMHAVFLRPSRLTLLAACLLAGNAVCHAAPATPHPFKSAGNPILADGSYYTADAAPLSHDGKLFLYCGRDEPAPHFGGFMMNEYAVLETQDPSSGDWTLHAGSLVPREVFTWATGFKAYAGHCLRGKDGNFYWYVPVEAKGATPRMAIGVAVSSSPTGPWQDPVGKPLVTWQDVFGSSEVGQEVIDPHTFIDDDGRAYLYWGSWGKARVVTLDHSMVKTTGPIQEMQGLDAFFEAPWVFKRNGTYYLAYDWKRAGSRWTPSNYQACIGYATATSPTGPWTFQDVILNGTSATTVHPSIIEHGGQWWITYHTRDAQNGGHFRRSVAIDPIRWQGDRMVPVKPSLTNPPEFALTNNLAREATVTASHTQQPPTTLAALHDGRLQTVMLPPDFWGNYRSNTNTVPSDWIRYDWSQPVRIEGVGIKFHQDPNWTRPPAKWSLEYLDAQGAWQPVAMTDYPTEPDRWHELRFTPIITTALRAMIHGQPQGEWFHSVLISEWEVHGVQAKELPKLKVPIADGKPQLPDAVELTFPDATSLSVPLRWLPQSKPTEPSAPVARARAIGQAAGYIEAFAR